MKIKKVNELRMLGDEDKKKEDQSLNIFMKPRPDWLYQSSIDVREYIKNELGRDYTEAEYNMIIELLKKVGIQIENGKAIVKK